MGVFIPKEDANEILGAITTVWSEDLRYRVSRVKARLKFMVDDIGPEGIRERVEARLGRKLEDYALPPITVEPSHHMGVHPQKQDGLSYIGVPVHLGLICGDQMIAVADLAERFGGDIRLTRQQNFIVTGVPNESVDEAVAELERIGFPLDINPVRGNSIACTGEPHCNFSVAETKTRLGRLIDSLEERFGDAHRRPAAAPRRLPARVRPALGRRPRLPGHDLARRGRRAPAGLRHLRARQPRPRAADRQARSSAACRPTSSTPRWRGSSRAGSTARRTARRSSRSRAA